MDLDSRNYEYHVAKPAFCELIGTITRIRALERTTILICAQYFMVEPIAIEVAHWQAGA